MTLREKVDVVIVGSGAAGSVLAAKLAAGGRQVVILESGPSITPSDMYSSQIWARRLKWGGSQVLERGEHLIAHGINAGWGTGGAATHHYGCWPRLHEVDFISRTKYGVSLDWPFDYAALRPYYDRIQAEVGLSGDDKAEVWRPPSDPYQMKPMPTFAQGRIIDRGFRKLGMSTCPAPLAVNTEVRNNRPPCFYDGWCDAGCPIGALANPQTIYLPQAKQHGAVLQHDATVTRILMDKDGSRAIGVEYADSAQNLHEQHADAVVLAAFTIQTPKLLLVSATDKHPTGLANSSGLLGAYVQSHTGASVHGLFDEYTENHMGLSTGQLISQDEYDEKPKPDNAFGSFQWVIGNAKKPNDFAGIANARFDLFGDELDAFVKKAVRGMASMTSTIEDLPRRENRVTLSSKKDQHGVPLAVVTHNADPRTLALWRYVKSQGLKIMEAAGAKDIWAGGYGATHLSGGTIMGTESSNSVTNAYGQTHDVDNIFIGGASLFPTSGGVNTTFSIHAMALRTADYINKHWSQIST